MFCFGWQAQIAFLFEFFLSPMCRRLLSERENSKNLSTHHLNVRFHATASIKRYAKTENMLPSAAQEKIGNSCV
jgi:hypothetical protein